MNEILVAKGIWGIMNIALFPAAVLMVMVIMYLCRHTPNPMHPDDQGIEIGAQLMLRQENLPDDIRKKIESALHLTTARVGEPGLDGWNRAYALGKLERVLKETAVGAAG